jgi:hypothetical protein
MAAALPADAFLERFGGIPAANEGIVFPEFRVTTHVVPIRFGDVETPTRELEAWIIPQSAPLEVWIDPGYAGAYAVLFVAVVGSQVFVVDEIYAQGKTGEQVISEVQQKRGLWSRVKHGVIDVAAKQHHAMSSQIEVWTKLTGLHLSARPVAIPDGIMRHRTFLVDPLALVSRIFFDPKCSKTIWEHAEGYRYAETKPNRDTRELPIDANNHSCKAIAYGLVARFGYVDRKRPRAAKRTGPDSRDPDALFERALKRDLRPHRSAWSA